MRVLGPEPGVEVLPIGKPDHWPAGGCGGGFGWVGAAEEHGGEGGERAAERVAHEEDLLAARRAEELPQAEIRRQTPPRTCEIWGEMGRDGRNGEI